MARKFPTEIVTKIPALFVFVSAGVSLVHGYSFPADLVQCYHNVTNNSIPMTMSSFVGLLKKFEDSLAVSMDLRTTAYTLLHRLRIDGIRRNIDTPSNPGVIPYGITGNQRVKHQFLLDKLLPGDSSLFPDDVFTPTEKCALHLMISSSVDPWVRFDENTVCPYGVESSLGKSSISSCPIEMGVVSTGKWGTVSPGTVLAALVAATESQTVELGRLIDKPPDIKSEKFKIYQKYVQLGRKASISSSWAATVAGDAAEVALYQGPIISTNFVIGPGGNWDSKIIPQKFYFEQSHQDKWDMTDAEILGGIDGLILASGLTSWLQKMGVLRLSQVFDMYYSDRGISFDPSYKACAREVFLDRVGLGSTNQTAFINQTINMARALYFNAGTMIIEDTTLQKYVRGAIEAISQRIGKILGSSNCDVQPQNPAVKLQIIMDGTWSKERALPIVANISEELHLYPRGSSIAVMDGQDGTWLINDTYNVVDFYQEWCNETSGLPWPTYLNLPLSMNTILTTLAEEAHASNDITGLTSTVVLVMAYSATFSDYDIAATTETISIIRKFSPDTHFLFLGSQQNIERLDSLVALIEDSAMIAATSPNAENTVPEIITYLKSIPKRILMPSCNNKTFNDVFREFEEYLTPNQTTRYRIHPNYLKNSKEVSFRIRSTGYGMVYVCCNEDTSNVKCFELQDTEENHCSISSPCLGADFCQPYFITLKSFGSHDRCTEDDCQYPDQVRVMIQPSGLTCFNLPGKAPLLWNSQVLWLKILMLTVFTILN